jgi:hypothetical protein
MSDGANASASEALRLIAAALSGRVSAKSRAALEAARSALSDAVVRAPGPFVVRPLSATRGKDWALCLDEPGERVVAMSPGVAGFTRYPDRDRDIFEMLAAALNGSPHAWDIAKRRFPGVGRPPLRDDWKPIEEVEALSVADLKARWNVDGLEFRWIAPKDGGEPEPALLVHFDQGGWVDPYDRVYRIDTRRSFDPSEATILSNVEGLPAAPGTDGGDEK